MKKEKCFLSICHIKLNKIAYQQISEQLLTITKKTYMIKIIIGQLK